MKAYVYDWTYSNSYQNTVIYLFCLDEQNETICITVHDFLPFFFIELPNKVETADLDSRGQYISYSEPIEWSSNNIEQVKSALNKGVFRSSDIKYKVESRKKLYYAKQYPYFTFLKCHAENNTSFGKWGFKLKYPLNTSLGKVQLAAHETHVSPILQFCCEFDLPMTGWIEFEGIEPQTKETSCFREFQCEGSSITPLRTTDLHTPRPVVLSFDLEVYSENPNRFPEASNASDCIFQISCVFWKIGHDRESYLLTIGDADEKVVGEDEPVTTVCFEDEVQLLIGFMNLVKQHNPQLITGWNILVFDINYMISRCKLLLLDKQFSSLGMISGEECKELNESWSSSAYGSQSFKYYQWNGRIVIDLLVFAQREIKSENYKLETIASMFIKAHKDPLTAQDIFRSFEYGVLRKLEFGERGKQLLSECGKYCVKDSVLVQRLFDEFDMWIGLTEMSAVCHVPTSYLYTKGQQIKVFSQVYKYCHGHEFVVETNGYECKSNERYQGAYVKEPIPGIYEYVIPFDFTSLYPTLIAAYNIDYSTFVIDDSIPDEKCNVMEWSEEHVYDIHDCIYCKRETRGERASTHNKLLKSDFTTTITCDHCFKTYSQTFKDLVLQPTTIKKKDKIALPTKLFIDEYRYRFLKEPQGVLPTIIMNLLNARTKVRKQMKSDSLNPNLKNILNKRQLSYKVSANSMYGALGVQKGMLPLMPGAMCVTAMGRLNLHKAAQHLIDKYGVNWIYSDTDSTYVQFPGVEPSQLWVRAQQIEHELVDDKVFPFPMQLKFEEAIYDPFFILTKKRYMWKCYEDGKRSDKVGNKGVVLARRGSSKFVKDIYERVIYGIFDGWTKDTTLNFIVDYMNKCCSLTLPIGDFVITKRVGNEEDYADDRALPAHAQLAETIRNRGGHVDVGQRLEYVAVDRGNLKAKVTDKIEDLNYQRKYAHLFKIDHLYYIHLTVKILDEVLTIVFKTNKFMETQYVLRTKKYKLHQELNKLFKPALQFES